MLKARHYKAIKEIKTIARNKEIEIIIINLQNELERRSFVNIKDYKQLNNKKLKSCV